MLGAGLSGTFQAAACISAYPYLPSAVIRSTSGALFTVAVAFLLVCFLFSWLLFIPLFLNQFVFAQSNRHCFGYNSQFCFLKSQQVSNQSFWLSLTLQPVNGLLWCFADQLSGPQHRWSLIATILSAFPASCCSSDSTAAWYYSIGLNCHSFCVSTNCGPEKEAKPGEAWQWTNLMQIFAGLFDLIHSPKLSEHGYLFQA